MIRAVQVVNRQRSIPFPRQLSTAVRHSVEAALSNFGLLQSCELSVSIVSPVRIRRLNREHRAIDATTDVLSFPCIDWNGAEPGILPQGHALDIDYETQRVMLGDVIVCLSRAAEQAQEYGHSLTREICFLAVHGALHLIGFDHESPCDERRMQKIAETVLEQTGQTRANVVVQTDQR